MIRLAKPLDAEQAVTLMIQAMGEVVQKLTLLDDPILALPFFITLFQQKGNQYSYEHTLVYELDGSIVGSITGYDGAKLPLLRKPVLDYVAHHYQNLLEIEEETQAGEFYIDTVSVSADHQGKGIGKILLEAAILLAKENKHKQVGLLVNHENPSARRLYEKLGFRPANRKYFAGNSYDHMVYEIG